MRIFPITTELKTITSCRSAGIIKSGLVVAMRIACNTATVYLLLVCEELFDARVAFWLCAGAEFVDDSFGGRSPRETSLVFFDFNNFELSELLALLEVVVHAAQRYSGEYLFVRLVDLVAIGFMHRMEDLNHVLTDLGLQGPASFH